MNMIFREIIPFTLKAIEVCKQPSQGLKALWFPLREQ